MLNRRRFTAGVAAPAAGSTARAQSRAQSGRPLVVFLADQASAECKTWHAQREPLFVQSDA